MTVMLAQRCASYHMRAFHNQSCCFKSLDQLNCQVLASYRSVPTSSLLQGDVLTAEEEEEARPPRLLLLLLTPDISPPHTFPSFPPLPRPVAACR